MEKKPIALACRLDSERAIKLAKRVFEFLVQKGEVVSLETRIAPKIFPHNGIMIVLILMLAIAIYTIKNTLPSIKSHE